MRLPSDCSTVPHAAMAGLLLAGVIAACDRAEQPPVPSTEAGDADAMPAPPTDAVDAGDAMVTMRYDCDGRRVAVFGNDHATVTMDGRDIDLAHVDGSSPPRFSGEALEFSIAADGAVLAQDEGANWACTAE